MPESKGPVASPELNVGLAAEYQHRTTVAQSYHSYTSQEKKGNSNSCEPFYFSFYLYTFA